MSPYQAVENIRKSLGTYYTEHVLQNTNCFGGNGLNLTAEILWEISFSMCSILNVTIFTKIGFWDVYKEMWNTFKCDIRHEYIFSWKLPKKFHLTCCQIEKWCGVQNHICYVSKYCTKYLLTGVQMNKWISVKHFVLHVYKMTRAVLHRLLVQIYRLDIVKWSSNACFRR